GRAPFLRKIFDETAGDYDLMDRVMAVGSGSRYRRTALLRAGLAPGMDVLDVATGTELVAREAAGVTGGGGRVGGVDRSAGMLREARWKSGAWAVQGTAELLPFDDARFDFVSMGFALRHMADLAFVFAELRRVLKPGGTVCMLEITDPAGRVAHAATKLYV